jgi:hypothetical protein
LDTLSEEHEKVFGKPFSAGVTAMTHDCAYLSLALRVNEPPVLGMLAFVAVKDRTTGAGTGLVALVPKASSGVATTKLAATIGARRMTANFDRTMEPNMNSLISIY